MCERWEFVRRLNVASVERAPERTCGVHGTMLEQDSKGEWRCRTCVQSGTWSFSVVDRRVSVPRGWVVGGLNDLLT